MIRALLSCAVVALSVGLALIAGCASAHGPYTPPTEGSRDTVKAQELTRKAVGCLDSDPAKSESLLREALTADLFFAPAHNDLGILFLRRGELYSAAEEFEWAKKLTPGNPEPRVNLALTLEKAGRVDDALSAYASALEVCTQYMPAMQGKARLEVKSGRSDENTHALLREIAMAGESERWREWARGQLAKSVP